MKDVKLVIRAKDDASRAIDATTAALLELKNLQNAITKSAGKTDTVIGQLTEQYGRLNKELSTVSAIGKVSQEFDKAASSIGRMQEETRSAAEDFAKYARELEQAANKTARLKGEQEAASKSLKDQKAVISDLRREQSASTKEIKKAEAALAKLQTKLSKGTSLPSPKLAAGSFETFLRSDVENAKRAADDVSKALSKEVAEQTRLSESSRNLAVAIKVAVDNQNKLQLTTNRSSEVLSKSNESLKAARSEYGKIEGAAKDAGLALSSLAVSEQKLSEDTKLLDADLKKTATTLQALQRYSSGGGTFADPKTAAAIRSQREEISKTEVTWRLLQEEVRRLAAEMKAAGGPTQEQAAAFKQLVGASRQAKQEYQSQIATLAKLQGSARTTFGEFSRGSAELRKYITDWKRLNDQASQTPAKFNGLKSLISPFYGESRKALSLLQRIRGEVLALTSTYIGLYGVINNASAVTKAQQTLDASKNRLGAVFNQDQGKTADELRFLQGEADRLGISFGTLSDQYTKFLVAADAAGFTLSNTRKIFLSVAEAGRVNGLSNEQLEGTFNALQQIISKGKIQAEELRGQLGDRLPGAVQILAKALGVTTGELEKMLEAGDVSATQTTLLKFAKTLDEKFGSQLPAALRNTAAEIGRFQNNLFNAQLLVAKGGFVDALNNGLRELDKFFKSEDGRSFFLSLGAAAGNFIDVLALVPANIGSISTIIQGLIALKLASYFLNVAESMGITRIGAKAAADALLQTKVQAVSFASASKAVAGGIGVFGNNLKLLKANLLSTVSTLTLAKVGTTTLNGSFIVLRATAATLTATMRGLWTAVGGFPGLIISAVSYLAFDLLGSLATSVDDTTTALDEQSRIIDEVAAAYRRAKGEAVDYAKEVKGATTIELKVKIGKAQEEIQALRQSVEAPVDALGVDKLGTVKKLQEVISAFKAGTISADDFKKEINSIAETDPKLNTRLVVDLIAVADKTKSAEDKFKTYEAVLAVVSGTATEAQKSLLGLKETTAEVADSMDGGKTALDSYTSAIDKLKAKVPELAVELKKLKDLSEIDAAYKTAVENATTVGQVYAANAARTQAVTAVMSEADTKVFQEIAANTKVTKDLFDTIHKAENFRPKAYDDGYGTQTIGFGSTLVSGRKVQAGDTITRDDAMRQAVNDIAKIVAQIEALVKVPLADNQLKALVSYAYNAGIGSLARDGILKKLNAGDYGGTADAIRNGVVTSGGVFSQALKNRRADEANLFASGNDSPEILKSKLEAEQKITEEKQKQSELTQQTISDSEFELQQGELIAAGKGRQAAIEAAIRQARQQNKDISSEEIAKITEITGKLYDQKNATNGIKEAEERVNELYLLRQQLIENIEFAKSAGDTTKGSALQTQLASVNSELDAAVAKSIQLYQTLGGPGADLAVAKLEAIKNQVQQTGEKSIVTGDQINQMLAGGLSNAFDRFAEAIANGENTIESLKNAFLQFAADFLREIAQMIIKQAILNALQGVLGGGGGGIGGIIANGINALIRHDGTVSHGTTGPTRSVSAALFTNALRYHGGGIAGLKPSEVPTILKKGEVVDPGDGSIFSKVFGGGGGNSQPKIINAFDASSFLDEALSSKVGEKAILNFVRGNSGAFKAALG